MNIVEKHLAKFGLVPQDEHIGEIREILNKEADKEKKSQGAGNTELMKLCCVQLFSKKHFEDIFLIWKAKNASFDANHSIDIQLLCSNGLQETKEYLQKNNNELAPLLLMRIIENEKLGYFDDFSYANEIDNYQYYYSDEG